MIIRTDIPHPLCADCPDKPPERMICDKVDSCVVDFYVARTPYHVKGVRIPQIEIVRIAEYKRAELKAKKEDKSNG